MKILFINTGPWGTGSFTSIKGIAKELLKLGHKVQISFPDANFESIDKYEYYSNRDLYHIWEFPIQTQMGEIPTFPLMITDPHPRNPYPVTFKSLSDEQIQGYEQELRNHIAELVDSFKPDIIECHHIWYSSWVASQMGLDYIVTAHHSDQLGFMFDERAQPKAIAGALAAKKIIAISDFVKTEVLDLYHVDEKKIIVMGNGYDKDVFFEKDINKKHLLRKLGIDISDDALIVNFAGKISETKGFDILLQANKLLDPSMNIHFIAMGTGDLEGLCSKMDPHSYSLDNIHFVGHQPPEMVADIHRISLLSAMPSRSEGFGIAALEAMGCGVPVIVTRSGGPEFFSVGKIIDVESARQLADGIMEVLRLPPAQYQALRKEALAAAEKRSMAILTQKRIEIYRSILEKSDIY